MSWIGRYRGHVVSLLVYVFPGDEGGGAFSRLLRVKKISQGQSGREIWRRSCDWGKTAHWRRIVRTIFSWGNIFWDLVGRILSPGRFYLWILRGLRSGGFRWGRENAILRAYLAEAWALLRAVFNDMFCRSVAIAFYQLASVFKEDFKTWVTTFRGRSLSSEVN